MLFFKDLVRDFLIEGSGLRDWLLGGLLGLLFLSLIISCKLDVLDQVTVLEEVETGRDLDDLVLSDIFPLAHLFWTRWFLLNGRCFHWQDRSSRQLGGL